MEINKENLNKVLKEQREEYQRYLGVLAEDFGSQTKLIVEQYDGIKTDISDIKQTLNSHTEMLNSHTEILNSHTETLSSHTEMIGSMMSDIEIVKSDVEFIKNSLKKKVDIDEFSVLEKRVALLEKKLQRT